MKKIIALTSDGGMVIGKTYEVGANVASTLVASKRAKYKDSLPEEEVTAKVVIKKTRTRKTK